MLHNDVLQERLDTALAVVQAHPKHDLPLGYRYAIYATLGPRADLDHGIITDGYRRRTRLSILTTRYVLPLWEQILPDDDLPHRFLNLAERVLDGTLSIPDLDANWPDDRHLRTLWYSADSARMPRLSVGFAALNTLGVARSDVTFDPDGLDSYMDMDVAALNTLVAARRDVIFDPDSTPTFLDEGYLEEYDIDPPFYAAIAASNGEAWGSISEFADAAKRKAFWEWWLLEAVPTTRAAVL